MRKGDDRRQALLDTAERLFYARGYEQTSVQDILDELHFSKGGFYHHFESKLALLEAICEERARASCDAARAAVESCSGPAPEKLNAFFQRVGILQSARARGVPGGRRIDARQDEATPIGADAADHAAHRA